MTVNLSWPLNGVGGAGAGFPGPEFRLRGFPDRGFLLQESPGPGPQRQGFRCLGAGPSLGFHGHDTRRDQVFPGHTCLFNPRVTQGRGRWERHRRVIRGTNQFKTGSGDIEIQFSRHAPVLLVTTGRRGLGCHLSQRCHPPIFKVTGP
jgi:hypothetical protein